MSEIASTLTRSLLMLAALVVPADAQDGTLPEGGTDGAGGSDGAGESQAGGADTDPTAGLSASAAAAMGSGAAAAAGDPSEPEPAVGAAREPAPGGASAALRMGDPASGPGIAEPAPSRWYLERGTHRRQPLPGDDIPAVADQLATLMRDDRVPGFYDGQFAATAEAFDELARLVADESVEHTLRMMAVMALQEAADGDRLAAALEPLLLPEEVEFQVELGAWWDNGRTVEEESVREILAADLSRHARFALAKDGQPEAVLAKIREMERYVDGDRDTILDDTIRSAKRPSVALKRDVWFDIAYHYQQFDDFRSASAWFREMADNLTGAETTWCHYNLACIAAIEGRPDEAMVELGAAVTSGFSDVGWMQEDGDLESLRQRADWAELVRSMGGTPNSNADASGVDPVVEP